MVSHKSGGKPARARRLTLRASLRKPKTDAALGSSLNSGAQPWNPPANVPAVVAPTSMLDGVLDSAIFTLDVHVRYLEQRMAARLRALEELKLAARLRELEDAHLRHLEQQTVARLRALEEPNLAARLRALEELVSLLSKSPLSPRGVMKGEHVMRSPKWRRPVWSRQSVNTRLEG